MLQVFLCSLLQFDHSVLCDFSVYRKCLHVLQWTAGKRWTKKKVKKPAFLRRQKEAMILGQKAVLLFFLQRNTDRCHHSTYNAESNAPIDDTLIPVCIIIFHLITTITCPYPRGWITYAFMMSVIHHFCIQPKHSKPMILPCLNLPCIAVGICG